MPSPQSSTKKKVKSDISGLPVLGATARDIHSVPAEMLDVPAHPQIIAQYVRLYLTNKRQGTASAKDRSQVIATTKKMYRQKGTGNARHGSKKAPIFVGGGVVGGPKPKDYTLTMNKKQRRLAFLTALSEKSRAQAVFALSKDADATYVKTKDFAKFLTKHAGSRRVTLVVDAKSDGGLIRAARNIANIQVVSYQSLNPYTILDNQYLIFTHTAINQTITHITPHHAD